MKISRISAVLSIVFALVIAAGVFAPTALAKSDKPKDIYSIVDLALDVNASSGEFSILIAALQAADPAVIQALDSKGQYTVFAPTDAAFLSLLAELGVSAGDLLSNQELLTTVLLYHVAPGSRDSGEVIGSDRIRTLQGGFLFQSGGVLTDTNGRSSNIVAVDIFADNGVVHIIDTVVLP
jgi:uncharacterized surface protein with fasciclin (FAS1) repeats